MLLQEIILGRPCNLGPADVVLHLKQERLGA
jgi:hypothetical protein